jgi:hypothetical protein
VYGASPPWTSVLRFRISDDLMNALFGNTKGLSEGEDCFTSRMTVADFGIAFGLFWGLIGLERRRQ